MKPCNIHANWEQQAITSTTSTAMTMTHAAKHWKKGAADKVSCDSCATQRLNFHLLLKQKGWALIFPLKLIFIAIAEGHVWSVRVRIGLGQKAATTQRGSSDDPSSDTRTGCSQGSSGDPLSHFTKGKGVCNELSGTKRQQAWWLQDKKLRELRFDSWTVCSCPLSALWHIKLKYEEEIRKKAHFLPPG